MLYYYYYYYVKSRNYDFKNIDDKLYIPPFRCHYFVNTAYNKIAENCFFLITIRGFHCHDVSTVNSMRVKYVNTQTMKFSVLSVTITKRMAHCEVRGPARIQIRNRFI